MRKEILRHCRPPGEIEEVLQSGVDVLNKSARSGSSGLTERRSRTERDDEQRPRPCTCAALPSGNATRDSARYIKRNRASLQRQEASASSTTRSPSRRASERGTVSSYVAALTTSSKTSACMGGIMKRSVSGGTRDHASKHDDEEAREREHNPPPPPPPHKPTPPPPPPKQKTNYPPPPPARARLERPMPQQKARAAEIACRRKAESEERGARQGLLAALRESERVPKLERRDPTYAKTLWVASLEGRMRAAPSRLPKTIKTGNFRERAAAFTSTHSAEVQRVQGARVGFRNDGSRRRGA